MHAWIESLIRRIDRPRFAVGDLVRFEPDERAMGWTQDMHSLYPGYVGRVTRLVHGGLFTWGVYVDDKPIEFLDRYFRRVDNSTTNDGH